MAATRKRTTKRPAKAEREERAPRKLNRELVDQIASVIRAGNYIETAAAYAGIHKDTFYDWLKRGRYDIVHRRRSIHREFVEAVDVALAQAEVRDLAIIGKAAEEIWQAAAWRLERRMPEKYGRYNRVEMTGRDGGPVEFAQIKDIDSAIDAVVDELAVRRQAKAARPAANGTVAKQGKNGAAPA